MEPSTLDSLLIWIGENPRAAGAVVFVIAFVDALLLVGLAVPALPLLFGVGTLVGLGLINPWYAIACAAAGAFLGDALSFGIGRRAGPRMRGLWPFSRYPGWLVRGEVFVARHGLKGIVIARYVGAVRPIVPAIAGMLQMPLRRFLPPSLFAAASWAVVFIAPGWLFGAWLELLAAVAGRLAVVVGVLAVLLGLLALSIFALYRVLAPRTTALAERLLAWSHRHPVLGCYSGALIDPKRPESPSLALLALALLATSWSFFWLLLMQVGGGQATGLDLRVHRAFASMRNPLADPVMASLSVLGDWMVLAPAVAAVALWLLWRRRLLAALHWIGAVAVGLGLVLVLGMLLDVPRPPATMLAPGFSFPSTPVAMATVVYGFFAVLVTRELPGRRRGWPYVVAGLLVGIVAFSRLYLGAHWFTDILAGVLLGLAWITGIGIAYRRRVVRSYWVRPVSATFFLTILVSAAWFGPRTADETLARFEQPLLRSPMPMDDWWQTGWQRLPPRRNGAIGAAAWPLNVEYAGDLERLADQLAGQGWSRLPQAGWDGLLRTLANDASPATVPVLPSAHQGRAESLLLSRPGDRGHERTVLRLWPAPYSLTPDDLPLWLGTVQTLEFRSRAELLRFWEARADDHGARRQLRATLAPLPLEVLEDLRDDGSGPVIRLRDRTAGR